MHLFSGSSYFFESAYKLGGAYELASLPYVISIWYVSLYFYGKKWVIILSLSCATFPFKFINANGLGFTAIQREKKLGVDSRDWLTH